MHPRRSIYIHLYPAAPRWKTLAVGAALGLLNGVLIVSNLPASLLALLIPGVLIAGLWWLTPRTRDTWSIHLFAMGHAWIGGTVCMLRWWRPRLPASPAALADLAFGAVLVYVLAYCALFILCLALVLLFSLLRRRRIIQDGTLCPNCLYSLRGNRTGRCPECGRPFTPADLGLTDWPDA